MKNIYNLLAEENLAEALEWLFVKTEQIGNDALSSTLQNVRTQYAEHICKMIVDENTELDSKFRQTLIQQSYSINDQANRLIRLYKSPSQEYCKSVTKSHDTPEEKFCYIWTSDLWTDEDEILVRGWIYDTDEENARFVPAYISAIMLAIMEMFDERKLMFLLDAQEDLPVDCQVRALTGFLLSIIRYDGRMNHYPQIESRFRLLQDNSEFVDMCYVILSNLQYSKLTDSVTNKINNDIMPNILKSKNITNLMSGDISKEEFEEGENPEWLNNGDEIFVKKMDQMTNMLKEGTDINMASFGSQKIYPFFNNISHWFFPYYEDVVLQEGITVSQTVRKMLLMAPFCDSDKYSFALMMGTKGEDVFGKQLEEEMNALQDAGDLDMEGVAELSNNVSYIIRCYVHDLYRFFVVHPLHGQFFNPFDKQLRSFSPMHRQSMNSLLSDAMQLSVLAEFFMKRGEYADAREMFLYLEPKKIEDDVELWQKIGFCEQKLNMPEALDTLLIADKLQPNSKWTIQHIAQIAFQQQKYEITIKYLDQLLEQEPNKLKFILKKAECLFALESYQDAVSLLYKVIYLDEDSMIGKQMLAWGLFMTKQYDKSSKLYAELSDTIMLGHIALAQGDKQLAYEYYSHFYTELLKQSSGDTTDKFKNAFWKFSAYLNHVDIDKQQLHLLYDATLMQARKP